MSGKTLSDIMFFVVLLGCVLTRLFIDGRKSPRWGAAFVAMGLVWTCACIGLTGYAHDHGWGYATGAVISAPGAWLLYAGVTLGALHWPGEVWARRISDAGLRRDNRELHAENERLREENERLRSERHYR